MNLTDLKVQSISLALNRYIGILHPIETILEDAKAIVDFIVNHEVNGSDSNSGQTTK